MSVSDEPRIRILIVDDDADFLALTQDALKAAGLEPEGVERADAALARLDRQTFDAVVVDLRLPAMDGWTLASTIRARQGPRFPVIVLSGVSSFRRLSDGLLAGANCYLPKATLRPERLAAALRSAVEASS